MLERIKCYSVVKYNERVERLPSADGMLQAPAHQTTLDLPAAFSSVRRL